MSWGAVVVCALVLNAAAATSADPHRPKARGDNDDEDFLANRIENRAVGNSTELVLERFIETLLSSERYLKKIDSVDSKLKTLDRNLHDRTNSIVKYLSEILKKVKRAPLELQLLNMLTSVQDDTRKLTKTILSKDFCQNSAVDLGKDSESVNMALDKRLGRLEDSLKSLLINVETIMNSEQSSSQNLRPSMKAKMDILDENPGNLDTKTLVNEIRKTLHDARNRKCDCRTTNNADARFRTGRHPSDCFEIQSQGFNITGIYKIRPDDMDSFYVLCDLTTAGGGWTVFQNRFDGSQDFFRNWWDYKNGFGNLAGEFWLGLDKLHYLTKQKLYELRVELETASGLDAYAGYSVFSVGPEHEGYRISTLGSFYGSAGDSLSYHAGQQFSTKDVDNDAWKEGSCSHEHVGAWWYKECDKSNLNGKYVALDKDSSTESNSMYWVTFKSPSVPLRKSKMMIRPLPASRPLVHNRSYRTEFLGPQVVGVRRLARQPGSSDSLEPADSIQPNSTGHADSTTPAATSTTAENVTSVQPH